MFSFSLRSIAIIWVVEMSQAGAAKKQSHLSSFFQKKDPSESTPKSTGSLKRPEADGSGKLRGGENDRQDAFPLPSAKRARTSEVLDETPAELPERAPVKQDGPLTTITANRQRPASSNTTSTPVTSRTSKYIFDSSPQQENEEEEDEGNTQKRQELHRRFVKKLGKPDSIADIKRRNKFIEDETGGDPEDGEDEDAELEEEAPKPKGRKGAPAKKATKKLTPMEQQVVDIKRANVDTLLVVEVGYKFRFFGEDARTAAKELNIVCIPGKFRFDEHHSEAHLDRFASASIPVHRLHVHVKRLVGAGHKVGVVRQLETAALKAVGDNKSAPFTRKLTNLYTKATYIDDIEAIEQSGPTPAAAISPATGFLLCMTEINTKGYGNDEKVHVGMVAVQPATGDVLYDDFEDGFMRSEIETRLLHIAPSEFLLVGELSKATEKLVLHLSGSKTNVFGDKIRVERVEKQKLEAAQAHSHVSTFYAEQMSKADSTDGKASKVLDKILGLPENVIICLSSMIKHMADYGLEHVFDLTKYFLPFSARSHMLLNGNTLTSLEIYQNQTDHTMNGSLFWLMNKTQTRFGGRLLRKWVGRPLLDKTAIEARLDAVEELLDTSNGANVEKLRTVLRKIRTDLEKSLIRIYYGRCTRPELLNVLQALQMLASEFAHVTTAASTGFESPLITSAMLGLPVILDKVVAYLDMISTQAAKDDDKYAFFRDEHETEDISEHKFGIASVEQDLDALRRTAADKLGKKHPMDYHTVAGIDYLIEVENSSPTIKKVPASWTKISGTKKVSRYHPPEVVKLMRERDQHKESLAAACDKAFKDLLADISQHYQIFRDAIQNLAILDCLLSLATIASWTGYVKPTFTADTRIELEGARHPMADQMLLDSYVPNDLTLASAPEKTRALLLTGPNMGGKSSFVRSAALITIMAQIGSYVPAASAKLGILDAVFTRMGAFDNMMAGESTFMVELSETSDILKLATDRSLVVLDELGRGTSTHDGVAIAGSVLDYLVRDRKCLTLFITHYQTLARLADGFPGGELKNAHMRFREDGEDVTFLYEVGEGVAHRSYGLNVARLANVPEHVIATAGGKSRELEIKTRGKRIDGVVRLLNEVVGGEEEDMDMDMDVRLEKLLEGIEQL
jgi:DNA mismatch repair protein MSH3